MNITIIIKISKIWSYEFEKENKMKSFTEHIAMLFAATAVIIFFKDQDLVNERCLEVYEMQDINLFNDAS